VLVSWEVGEEGRREVSHKTTPRKVNLANVLWGVEDPILFASIPQDIPVPGEALQPSRRTLRLQHVARTPSGFQVEYRGSRVLATVRTSSQYTLGMHMLPKVKRDTSKVLVSPMPGRLVSLAVKVGDSVEVGQELAIVEVRFLPFFET